jgi:hypothetical protein
MEALSSGEISTRKAEMLSKLSSARQRRIMARERQKEDGQRVAALVIGSVLGEEKGRIDLGQVTARIVETIRRNFSSSSMSSSTTFV